MKKVIAMLTIVGSGRVRRYGVRSVFQEVRSRALSHAYPSLAVPCVVAAGVAGVLLGQLALMSPSVSNSTNAAAVKEAAAPPAAP